MNALQEDHNQNNQTPLQPNIRISGGSMTADPHQFNSNEQFIQATMAATGLKDGDLEAAALNQLVDTLGKVSEAHINTAIAALADFRCKNAAEVMIASHTIALHHQAVDLLTKAAGTRHPDLHKAYLGMALKLLQAFESLMETSLNYLSSLMGGAAGGIQAASREQGE